MPRPGEKGGGGGERNSRGGRNGGRRGCGLCPGLEIRLFPGDVLSPLGIGMRGLCVQGLMTRTGGNVHIKKGLLGGGRSGRLGEKVPIILMDYRGLSRID